MRKLDRIESKVAVVFEIADRLLSGEIQKNQAKTQLDGHMAQSRPAQIDRIRDVLSQRIESAADVGQADVLVKLIGPYLRPSYHMLEPGHPIRNYFNENTVMRQILIDIDKLDGESASVDVWMDYYEKMMQFNLHIERQAQCFFKEAAKRNGNKAVAQAVEMGSRAVLEVENNHKELCAGNILDFIFNQRMVVQQMTQYLDMEEKVLYPDAIKHFEGSDWERLRRADDAFGYVYIETPPAFNVEFVKRADPNPFQVTSEKTGDVVVNQVGAAYLDTSARVISTSGVIDLATASLIDKERIKGILDGMESDTSTQVKYGNRTLTLIYTAMTGPSGNRDAVLVTAQESTCKTCPDSVSLAPEISTGRLEVTPKCMIADLFENCSGFEEAFYSIDPELNGLRGPMGQMMLKDTSIDMLAKSMRWDVTELIDRIREIVQS